MVHLLLFAALLGTTTACTLPGYEPGYDDKCFKFIDRCVEMNDECYFQNLEACEADGAYAPIIRSAEEEDKFISFLNAGEEGDFIIGLTCNSTTLEYMWRDGTPLTYANWAYRPDDHPRECKGYYDFFMIDPRTRQWYRGEFSNNAYSYCQEPPGLTTAAPTKTPTQCGDFDLVAGANGSDWCLKVIPEPKSANDAESYCSSIGGHVAIIHEKQTNDYIRRTAMGHQFTDGIHIGLRADRNGTFAWSDNSYINYNNFEHGYPLIKYGECGMMSTAISTGKWVNVDCRTTAAPFVCTKIPQFPSSPRSSTCDDVIYMDGDHIYSPGFPSIGNVTCDYFLEAPAGKVVELQLIFIEAEQNSDILLLEDETIGGPLIANITGYTTPSVPSHSTSRYMWVHWKPTTNTVARGFHAVFRTVTPHQ